MDIIEESLPQIDATTQDFIIENRKTSLSNRSSVQINKTNGKIIFIPPDEIKLPKGSKQVIIEPSRPSKGPYLTQEQLRIITKSNSIKKPTMQINDDISITDNNAHIIDSINKSKGSSKTMPKVLRVENININPPTPPDLDIPNEHIQIPKLPLNQARITDSDTYIHEYNNQKTVYDRSDQKTQNNQKTVYDRSDQKTVYDRNIQDEIYKFYYSDLAEQFKHEKDSKTVIMSDKHDDRKKHFARKDRIIISEPTIQEENLLPQQIVSCQMEKDNSEHVEITSDMCDHIFKTSRMRDPLTYLSI